MIQLTIDTIHTSINLSKEDKQTWLYKQYKRLSGQCSSHEDWELACYIQDLLAIHYC